MSELLSSLNELFAHPGLGAEGIEVSRGTLIFDQGAVAEHVYAIHRGQVRLYQVGANGEERLVEILGAGQWCGCAALSERGAYTTRAVAATSGQLSKISAKTLLEHAARHPAAAVQLIQQLASHVQQAREEAARLQFDDCNSRLIQAMLRFSESAAATTQGSDVVLHLTHAQLAQAVGAARETISLALTELRLRNIVRTGRNRLIFNRDALKQVATQSSPQTVQSL
jgi:CRP/FNR family cyclic AMP-dependent transcriptional regulator